MGNPELADEERFATHLARGDNQEEIEGIVADWAREHDASEIDRILNEAGVPCGPIYSIDQAFADPQVKSLGMVKKVGEVPYLGQPVTLSRTPSTVVSHPPKLGEHTAEVLRELGYEDEKIDELRKKGIV
jgi:formyl-CoA transferase